MTPQFDTKLVQSFILWLDNRICADGGGFVNRGFQLFPQVDTARGGYKYASPWKEWVYDSCVSGAQIPTGVYNANGTLLNRNNGITFDFNNGRVLTTGNMGPYLSGNFASKEYNVYFSTEERTNFFLEDVYKENHNVAYNPTGIAPYDFAAPCVIVTNAYGTNEPFALGGQESSNRIFRLYTINDNNFNLEALNSIMVDSARKNFPLVEYSDMPLNFNGDLKASYSGVYNYCDLKRTRGCVGAFVKKTFSYKLNEARNKNTNYMISIYEFELEVVRYPT